MILVDYQIRNLCQQVERPMVSPFDESLVNPASLGVRLGPTGRYNGDATVMGVDAVVIRDASDVAGETTAKFCWPCPFFVDHWL